MRRRRRSRIEGEHGVLHGCGTAVAVVGKTATALGGRVVGQGTAGERQEAVVEEAAAPVGPVGGQGRVDEAQGGVFVDDPAAALGGRIGGQGRGGEGQGAVVAVGDPAAGTGRVGGQASVGEGRGPAAEASWWRGRRRNRWLYWRSGSRR